MRPFYAFIFLLILLAACDSGEETDLSRMGTPLVTRGVAVTSGPTLQANVPTPTPSAAAPTEVAQPVESPLPSSGLWLTAGEFDLPAAEAPGDAGFHEVFNRTHTLSDDLNVEAGDWLVLTLLDETRPGQFCAENDPRSGCTTIDWSDDEDVFENSLSVKFASGTRILYLSETGLLTDEPDDINEDCPYHAVGGRPEQWAVELTENIDPDSDLEITLTMTKFGAPDVTIAYEIRVTDEPPSYEGRCE